MKKVSVSLNGEQIGLIINMLEASHDLEDTEYNAELIKLNEYLNKRRRAAWKQ